MILSSLLRWNPLSLSILRCSSSTCHFNCRAATTSSSPSSLHSTGQDNRNVKHEEEGEEKEEGNGIGRNHDDGAGGEEDRQSFNSNDDDDDDDSAGKEAKRRRRRKKLFQRVVLDDPISIPLPPPNLSHRQIILEIARAREKKNLRGFDESFQNWYTLSKDDFLLHPRGKEVLERCCDRSYISAIMANFPEYPWERSKVSGIRRRCIR